MISLDYTHQWVIKSQLSSIKLREPALLRPQLWFARKRDRTLYQDVATSMLRIDKSNGWVQDGRPGSGRLRQAHRHGAAASMTRATPAGEPQNVACTKS